MLLALVDMKEEREFYINYVICEYYKTITQRSNLKVFYINYVILKFFIYNNQDRGTSYE